MQLNTKYTLHIKSTHLAHLVKSRLASVNPRCISLQENFSKALHLQIIEGSLQKQSLDGLELLFRGPAVFKGSVWFGFVSPADGQHRPLSCEASLWQVSWSGVAAKLGGHGAELPYSPGKSTIQIMLFPCRVVSLWDSSIDALRDSTKIQF